MVVEDEELVRLLVVQTLEEAGYSVIEAADAPAALALIAGPSKLDLLVTDVGLPGLNGRQLAEMARMERPDLKVLFMTGYAHNAGVGSGALDRGMEIIAKPFAVDALAGRVEAMLRA
jgi:DNA-binding response OmpR family regulator